jgi:hypothetical protein
VEALKAILELEERGKREAREDEACLAMGDTFEKDMVVGG